MLKTLVYSFAATLCIGGLVALADDMGGMDMSPKSPTSQPANDKSAKDLHNTVCPVTGDPVGDSKLTASYQGKLYHFCCDDCPKAFNKDPEKYAKAVASDPAKYGVKAEK